LYLSFTYFKGDASAVALNMNVLPFETIDAIGNTQSTHDHKYRTDGSLMLNS